MLKLEATFNQLNKMNSPDSDTSKLSESSLAALQIFANLVYGEVNSAHFELSGMLGRFSEYCSRICLWVRKGEGQRVDYHLCMALSWIFAVSSRLFPCNSIILHELLESHCAIDIPVDTTLSKLQSMFIQRHEGVSVQDAALCLAEKVLALGSAVGKYTSTHEEQYRTLAGRRMAQVLESLLVVAGTLNVRLNETYGRIFRDGCPKCCSSPCRCGYRIDKVQ